MSSLKCHGTRVFMNQLLCGGLIFSHIKASTSTKDFRNYKSESIPKGKCFKSLSWPKANKILDEPVQQRQKRCALFLARKILPSQAQQIFA